MDKKKGFKEYIEANEVLVVDKSPTSRNRLVKTMCDLGAKRNNIHVAAGMLEAEDIVEKKKIGIVLSEYIIGGGSGFDLFKIIRDRNNDEFKKLC
jgi:DNA-binding NtrC family response regulator